MYTLYVYGHFCDFVTLHGDGEGASRFVSLSVSCYEAYMMCNFTLSVNFGSDHHTSRAVSPGLSRISNEVGHPWTCGASRSIFRDGLLIN
jgi:hypothetical protein